MKGQIKPGAKKVDEWEWHPWYAWYPVKAALGDANGERYSSWRWVWLEEVECRFVFGPVIGDGDYLYRLPEEKA